MNKLKVKGERLKVKILTFSFLLLTCINAYPQDITGDIFPPEPPVKKEKKKDEKKVRKPEPFLDKIAYKFNMKTDSIYSMFEKGLGFTEIIKAIVLHKKSNEPLEEIVTKRQKPVEFKQLAERYRVDYKEIITETKRIKEELLTAETTFQIFQEPVEKINPVINKSSEPIPSQGTEISNGVKGVKPESSP